MDKLNQFDLKIKQPEVTKFTDPGPLTLPDPPPPVPGDPRSYALSLVGAGEFACLGPLWERESGWNPYAVNASSGAAGIAQSLGHGPVDLSDWRGQVDWGLGYIRGTYGNSCNALSHENIAGWY